jgi:Cd2+/Zn2+-exporting ATPase
MFRKPDQTAQSAHRFFVSGICCSTEQEALCRKLDAGIGAENYEFNPVTSELVVGANTPPSTVLKAVHAAGFSARNRKELELDEPFWKKHAMGVATGCAALLAAAGLFTEHTAGMELWAPFFFLSAILLAGWRVFFRAWKSLISGSLEMNVLMASAVIGALAVGKWGEGAAVMVLYAVSLMLESYSASRSRRAIQSLMKLAPEEATVVRTGLEQRLPAEDVHPGEHIIVRPGERVPLDGRILDGSTTVDQSVITGESIPVPRGPGEDLFAGSLNGRGSVRVLVTRKFTDTTLAHILHLVEDAQKTRAPIQGLVDRFARIYTPSVLVLALFVAVLPPLLLHESAVDWLYRALVLLVIACPCALVISTPITLVSAVTRAARRGILIKGGAHLESLAKLDAIAFDKTGTLTEGRPTVTDIIPLNSLSEDEMLRIAAAIELRSEHHLASAVTECARRKEIECRSVPVEHFEAVPGKGVRAIIGGMHYIVGNHQMCHDEAYCSPEVEHTLERLSGEGKTCMVLGRRGEALGVIGIQDAARQETERVVKSLRRSGIRHITMLSGDHERTAGTTARALGLDEYEGDLLPEKKVQRIRELRQQYDAVAMVGDGVNDAPAFAASTVGIAMGVSGSDTALQTADVVLMSDDLSGLPYLFHLSRKALSIVKQNVAIALGLKLLFLVLSLSGLATLWLAVLADDGAALIVILNGLRMLSFKAPS